MRAMTLGPDGELWSQELESFLVLDGHLRLTEAQARLAETRRADAEAKARQALAEKLRSLGIDPNQI